MFLTIVSQGCRLFSFIYISHVGSVIILGDLTICHKSVSLRYATQTSRL